uniref:hypothetical protein n=1 Tax=Ningiella ruwaisensis TaxID=2364274 RepID=UPI0010A0BF08|nr:hypothetical protein [Ningiella ruwaisensis]
MSKASDTNDPDISKHASQARAEEDLAKIRELIARAPIEAYFNDEKQRMRESVREVITQSLIDREKQDKSVSASIEPMIQASIRHSFTNQRQALVNEIFPLIGELVRKYVASALREFLEKTNSIIENSVSLKGLVWRYKAWRAGIPFAQYLVAQTHLFKVEQVLLIHNETGMLLNSANIKGEQAHQGDLISAMLTAISDFVSDSFSNSEHQQQLDEIKTDRFTLHVFRGPLATLAVAVIGNISSKARRDIQSSLEQIHIRYQNALNDFSGDADTLSASKAELDDCLLAEQKPDYKKKKRPIFALALIIAVIGLLAYYVFLRWETQKAYTEIVAIPDTQGVIPVNVELMGIRHLQVTLLRSPDAISPAQWLAQSGGKQKLGRD